MNERIIEYFKSKYGEINVPSWFSITTNDKYIILDHKNHLITSDTPYPHADKAIYDRNELIRILSIKDILL